MIEDDLYANLDTITGIVGKVYAVRASNSATLPYAVYNRISTQREQTLTSFGNAEIAFQLDIYHSTRAAMLTIKAAVITRLKTYNVLQVGNTFVQSIEILNEMEDVEELNGVLKFKGIVEFSLYHTE